MTKTTQIFKEESFLKRRQTILKKLENSLAIFSSNQNYPLSRDQHFPYRPDSDVLYLTGISEPETILLLINCNQLQSSILFTRDRDPEKERWDGGRLGVARAKKIFQVDDVKDIKEFRSYFTDLLKERLKGLDTVYYPAGVNEGLDNFIFKCFKSMQNPREVFAEKLQDSRTLTAPLRQKKDSTEILLTKKAIEITGNSLKELIKCYHESNQYFTSELHLARFLESLFTKYGAKDTAFSTIVASGSNASVLHHQPTFQKLSNKDLVLIDSGAVFENYCADITRCFPLGGKFTKSQEQLYSAVNKALKVGIASAKPKSTLVGIHQAIVKSICESLVSLKLIKGPVSKAIELGSYKKFYMHRSGHWLGIDVHDIFAFESQKLKDRKFAQRISSYELPLQPGNLFTIEPGIYIDSHEKSVPKEFRGIGIRLEENILITPQGCEVLSSKIPIEVRDIESLFS